MLKNLLVLKILFFGGAFSFGAFNFQEQVRQCQTHCTAQQTKINRLQSSLNEIAPLLCSNTDYDFFAGGYWIDKKTCGHGLEQEEQVKKMRNDIEAADRLALTCFQKYDTLHQAQTLYLDHKKTQAQRQGIQISCGEAAPEMDAKVSAYADIDEQQIVFNKSYFNVKSLAGSTSVELFHEMLHLIKEFNTNDAPTHNHPNENNFYINKNGKDVVDTSRKPREHTNIFYDRVYACQNFCASPDTSFLEQCTLCMSGDIHGKAPGCQKLPDYKTWRILTEN